MWSLRRAAHKASSMMPTLLKTTFNGSFSSEATSQGFLKSLAGVRALYASSCLQQRSAGEADFPKPPLIPFHKDMANTVHLIGHVGRKPDIKYLDSGKVCARSSIAVKRTSRSEDPPSWIALEFWDELAEIATHHLKKGDVIHVAGAVWVDKFEKDQNTSTIVKVVVRNVNFVTQQAEAVNDLRSSQEKKVHRQKLWEDLYVNPSDWLDTRLNKMNPKYPDFKHRTSGASLWVDSCPDWLKSKIRTLALRNDLGTRSSNISSAPF